MQSFLRAESLLLPGALGFPSLVAFLTTSLHMGKLRARERGSLPERGAACLGHTVSPW